MLQTNPADPEHPHQFSRPLFVNTGSLDGHQARTRRQIDELKAVRDTLAEDDPRRVTHDQEIRCCWRLYEARNRELAHLAANVLLFARVWNCSLISGESLKTLKTTGRGRGVRGRWRNWRNNTTIRADIWRILRYKSHLLGLRFRSERPRGTSHTCPCCGKGAATYRSPRLHHRSDPVKWAAGSGAPTVATMTTATTARPSTSLAWASPISFRFNRQAKEKPSPWPRSNRSSRARIARGAVLLLPPQTDPSRLMDSGKIYLNGWKRACSIRSSYATPLFLRLCS